MKQIKFSFLIISLIMILSNVGWGQIYYHDFGTTAITTKPYIGAPVTFDANLNTSSWTTSALGFGGLVGNGGNPSQSLSLSNSSGTPTFTLTFNVASGYQLSITSFNFWRMRSNTGATNWSMTINGISVGSGSISTTGASLGQTNVANTISGLTGTVTLVYTMSGASGTGTCRLDDFTLYGTVTSTSGSGTSTVTAGSSPEPPTLSSLINIQENAVLNFDFKLTDDGSTPGTDNLVTQISQIVINQGTENDITDWTQAIQGALLTDGTSTQTTNVTINATNIVFASISNASSGDLGYIADNGNKTYTLKIWLKNTLGGILPDMIDGLNFVFGVNNSSFTFNGGSQLAASQEANSGSNNNAVEVVATKLNFVQQPTNTVINSTMSPAVTIEATDANGNRDLDKTGTVNLSSSGTMTGPVTATLSSGLGTFGDIIHTALGTGLTLTASLSGLTDAISNSFNITNYVLLLEENFSYTVGTLLTANGWTAHDAGGTNPIKVTSPGLSYLGYISSGIGNAATLTTSGEDDNKAFTSQTSGSVYCAFIVNVTSATASGDYFLHLIESGTSYYGRVFAKSSGSGVDFGISKKGNTASYSGNSYSLNTTYLIVLKYTFGTGTNDDAVNMFINPAINGTEPTPILTSSDDVTDATKLTALALRQGSSSPALIVDGIRVGKSWNEVVPVISTPFISTTGTLTPFSTTFGTPSESQNYTVAGSNLTSGIIITPPANFEVSTDNVNWVSNPNTITLAQMGGTVANTTIYVRYNPSGAGTHSGNISHTSTGSTQQDVAVSGYSNTLFTLKNGGKPTNINDWEGNPKDFSTAGQTFNISNNTNVSIEDNWTVSGTNSKIVVTSGVNFNIPYNFTVTGTVDVNDNATLTIDNATLPTLGTLGTNSTIVYEQNGLFSIPNNSTYGNLTLKNGTKTFVGNTTTVSGNLTFDNVTIDAPSATPFATIALSGDLTYLNSVVNPADANSITLNCAKNGTQTITGNGKTVRFFRIATIGTNTNVVLSTTGGSTNLLLANSSGGGLTLGSGTNLTVNSNTIKFLTGGKGVFLETGTLSCDGSSNLILNTLINAPGTIYFANGANSVNNLTINETGTGNFTLGSSLTINGTLTLTNGNLSTGTNTLYFGTSATNPVESSGNTIIGTAVMNSRAVGTGELNFLSANIETGSDDLGSVVITRKTGTAGIITVGIYSSIACNWLITPTTQPTNGRNVTYSWLSDFDNGKNFSSTNKGQVWISTDNGANWVESGLPVDVSGSDPRTITNNVTHFSNWAVSSQDAPMPVTLASLTSNVNGRNIVLNWSTSSEINNAGFDVERKSATGDWQKTGYVKGNGTTNENKTYSYKDMNLQTGKYYYRLKQIDYNGNFEYHNLTDMIEVGVPEKFALSQNYPNPFNPVTKINFDLPKDSKVDMRIYDMLGREVALLLNEVKTAGYYTINFNASRLSSGIYFYRLSTGDFTSVKKLVVIK